MPQKPETAFRRRIYPQLLSLPNTVWFPIQQTVIVGDPDFIGCVRGRFVALELKVDGEAPRKIQQYKLDLIAKTGGIALVATPMTWEAVYTTLKKLAK